MHPRGSALLGRLFFAQGSKKSQARLKKKDIWVFASARPMSRLLMPAGEELLRYLRRARSKYRARRKFHVASIIPTCFSPSKSFCYARNQLLSKQILLHVTHLEVGDLKMREFCGSMLLSAALSAARTERFPKAVAFGVLLASLLVTRQEVTYAQQRARCASVRGAGVHSLAHAKERTKKAWQGAECPLQPRGSALLG